MKTPSSLFYWLPRLSCILAILFISMFAGDALEQGNTWAEKAESLVMHLLPTFILTILLIIAWKWELIGGILFTIVGLITTPLVFLLNYNRNHFTIAQCLGIVSLITVPLIVIGVLFIVSYIKSRQQRVIG